MFEKKIIGPIIAVLTAIAAYLFGRKRSRDYSYSKTGTSTVGLSTEYIRDTGKRVEDAASDTSEQLSKVGDNIQSTENVLQSVGDSIQSITESESNIEQSIEDIRATISRIRAIVEEE